MTFSNAILETADVTAVSELSYTPVEARYIRLRRVLALINIAVIVVLGLVAHKVAKIWFEDAVVGVVIITTLLLVLFVLIALHRWFADPKKCYVLREQDLSYQYGLIFRTTTTQPINRVQHVEVKQGPIERRYDLASLLAYSAGGQMHTFFIAGLNFDDAKRMRAYILEHKESVLDAG